MGRNATLNSDELTGFNDKKITSAKDIASTQMKIAKARLFMLARMCWTFDEVRIGIERKYADENYHG